MLYDWVYECYPATVPCQCFVNRMASVYPLCCTACPESALSPGRGGLWRPGREHFPHCVPSFPSGTICCLSSPRSNRLAASAEWPAAWGSTVHVCMSIRSIVDVCVVGRGGGVLAVVSLTESDRNIHFSQSSCWDVECVLHIFLQCRFFFSLFLYWISFIISYILMYL